MDVSRLVQPKGNFSLVSFRTQNNRIKDGSWDLMDKIIGFAELDIIVGIEMLRMR
jgi:hypothetical protein